MMKEEKRLALKQDALKELEQIDGFYLSRDAVLRLDQRSSQQPLDERIFAPLMFIGDHDQEMLTYAETVARILFLNDVLDSDKVERMKAEELDWIIEARDVIDDDDYDRAEFSRAVYEHIVAEVSHPFGVLYLEDSDHLFLNDEGFERFPIVSALYGIAEQKIGFLTVFAGKLEGMRDLFLCTNGFDLYDPENCLWFDDISRYWKAGK